MNCLKNNFKKIKNHFKFKLNSKYKINLNKKYNK